MKLVPEKVIDIIENLNKPFHFREPISRGQRVKSYFTSIFLVSHIITEKNTSEVSTNNINEVELQAHHGK